MNGAEHFNRAADLLNQAEDLVLPADIETARLMVASAGVHAQLAAIAVAHEAFQAAGLDAPAAQDLPAPRPVPRTLVDTSDDPPPPR